jgi:hypothetical protein
MNERKEVVKVHGNNERKREMVKVHGTNERKRCG